MTGHTVEQAWHEALYGPRGFYRRELPADHFRTACHAAPDLLAGPLLRLAALAGCDTVVDVGAGAGELMSAVAAHPHAAGLRLLAVDLRPRPPGLPERVQWSGRIPPLPGSSLLIGWELLDVVSCPLLQADDTGRLRELLVAPDGAVTAGGDPSSADLTWCRRWWPGPHRPGDLVEVGRPRDEFWAELTGRQEAGLALAVDYDHLATSRPAEGTLLGYRDGAARAPQWDGGADLTAHVALDAVAARLGPAHLLARQHTLLRVLGVHPANPPHALAAADPLGYLAELDRAGRGRELLDPAGLGGFGWLLSARGPTAQDALAALRASLPET